MSNPEPAEVWHLDTEQLGRRTLVFDRLDSTSTLAALLANDPANDGIVIVANEQTEGRGQHGRSWSCPPGAGVLLSALLFPPAELRRAALLTAWAAVSVCETIREVANIQAKIKWPNDVLLRGQKVCGILSEMRNASRGTRNREWYAVVGIGLNVNQPAEVFVEAGLSAATSLAVCAGRAWDRDEVARALIRRLDEEYSRLCQGDRSTLESDWKGRVGLLGKQVAAEGSDGIIQGRLRDQTWEGLEIEQADGKVLRLLPESVRQLRPA